MRVHGLCPLSDAEPGPVCKRLVFTRARKLVESLWTEGNWKIRPGARLKVPSRNYDGTLSLAVEKRELLSPTVLRRKKSGPQKYNSAIFLLTLVNFLWYIPC